MPLSEEELERLLQAVANTAPTEIDCDGCLALVAEFAEQQLVGASFEAGLRAVEQHLSVCDECREEYEALKRTLSAISGDSDA